MGPPSKDTCDWITLFVWHSSSLYELSYYFNSTLIFNHTRLLLRAFSCCSHQPIHYLTSTQPTTPHFPQHGRCHPPLLDHLLSPRRGTVLVCLYPLVSIILHPHHRTLEQRQYLSRLIHETHRTPAHSRLEGRHTRYPQTSTSIVHAQGLCPRYCPSA